MFSMSSARKTHGRHKSEIKKYITYKLESRAVLLVKKNTNRLWVGRANVQVF